MAKMIPAYISPNTQSDGEIAIFNALQSDANTGGWTVLHSLDIAKHVSQITAEIDFVVIIPEVGIACIEVKACRHVQRVDGAWIYGNNPKLDLRGPFKQAEAAQRSISEYLFRKDPSIKKIPFFSIGVFTHLNFPERSVEWHPWQCIDQERISKLGIANALLSSISSGRKHLTESKTAKWFQESDKKPTYLECRRLVSLLRSEFEYFESPLARRENAILHVKQYTEEQFDILDFCELNERTAIIGPAGTGKTFLAIEMARREASLGRSVIFLCYNRMLSKWLQKELAPLGKSVTCSTIDSYMVNATGLEPDESNEFWEEKLPLAFIELLNQNDKLCCDTLIIDEAQDFMSIAYIEVLNAMLKKKLSHGYVRLFGDFWAQSVHRKEMSLDELKKAYIQDLAINSLKKNCRNSPKVATLAAGFLPDIIAYSSILRSDDGVKPEIIIYKDLNDQEEKLFETVQKYKDRYIGLDEIAVISTAASGGVVERMHQNYSPDRKSPEQLQNGMICTSIRKFKGMERLGIIVTDIDNIDQHMLLELLYIAATRTIGQLTLLVNAQLKNSSVFKGI